MLREKGRAKSALVWLLAVISIFAVDTKDLEHNWAGNVLYGGGDGQVEILLPKTVLELQEMVGREPKLKVLGTRHSFSKVADVGPTGKMISTAGLNKIVSCCDGFVVTVEPGVNYAELGSQLHEMGQSLHNYASLPHISVAGAVSTATHGSGLENGNLATAVQAVSIVMSNGTQKVLKKDVDPDFNGAVISFGALGAFSQLSLKTHDAFDTLVCIYTSVPLGDFLDDVDGFFGLAYSVSAFFDWGVSGKLTSAWLKHKTARSSKLESSPECTTTIFNGDGVLELDGLHPIPTESAQNCSRPGIGPSFMQIPHFRPDGDPSNGGDELQAEYFVPLSLASQAISDLMSEAVRSVIHEHILISEFRVVAPDNLWMSPCFNESEPCVGIHFTWKNNLEGVLGKVLPLVEQTLSHYEAKPHLGKLFTISGDGLRQLYPAHAKFTELVKRYDPEGKFSNPFLEEFVFSQSAPHRIKDREL